MKTGSVFILVAFVVGLFVATQPAVANAPCVEDFDASGVVDTGDISLLLLDFGVCAGCGADLDEDGRVSGSDLALLLLSFGPCPWYTVLEQMPNSAVVHDAGLREAITATGLPWRVRDNGTAIEMVLIPPGTFMMGQLGVAEPVHPVTITNAFYIGRYEVTQAQWKSAMGGVNPSYFVAATGYPGSDQRPVDSVTWFAAQAFTSSFGLRLPTEAEWEYACRAGTWTAYHGFAGYPYGTNSGSLVGNIAWYTGNNGAMFSREYGTKPVGALLANGFGLHDTLGNVQEWCNDWLGEYPSSPQTDPAGPADGYERVLRGGSWKQIADYCRTERRSAKFPWTSDDGRYIGLRVVRSP